MHSPHGEELAHFLPPRAHHLLVLADAQLLAVDDTRALGPRLVLIVGVFLQVDLAQTSLLLVVRLLLLVRHGLPARAWVKQENYKFTKIIIIKYIHTKILSALLLNKVYSIYAVY